MTSPEELPEPRPGLVTRAAEWVGRLDASGRAVVQAWFGTRLLLAVTALAVMVTTGRTAEGVLANWDVLHFLAISRDGYAVRNDVAFFPGLPMLLHAAAQFGIPEVAAGVLFSLVGSAFAAAAIWRLGGGGIGGAAAAIAWLLAPMGVFTFVPYTESLFCALAFWAWERAKSDRWAQAAALAAGACALRVSGLFLIAALAVELVPWSRLREVRRLARPVLVKAAWLLLPSGVLATYVVYLRLTQGSWTAWFEAQAAGWSRGVHSPWDALQTTIDAATPGYFPGHDTWHWLFKGEIVSMALGVALVVALLVSRRWGEAMWVGAQVAAFATSSWFISVNRSVLLWFPLWLLIGRWLATGFDSRGKEARAAGGWHASTNARLVLLALLILGVIALGIRWSVQFFTGDWAS